LDYQSKWRYPNSDVYKNKLELRDSEQLERAERKLTALRQVELDHEPVSDGKWNLKHLQKIHKHLFQDVYEFAGKIRTEQIQKGYTQFASPLYIESYATDVFNQLKKDNYLKDLPKEKFTERLAYYMGEINMLHPFYEGNGRTNREFIRTLALSNGYTLEWTKLDQKELMNASIHSIVDHKPLAKLLEQATLEQEPSKAVMRQWKELGNELEM
jgi:cell filamentation protein